MRLPPGFEGPRRARSLAVRRSCSSCPTACGSLCSAAHRAAPPGCRNPRSGPVCCWRRGASGEFPLLSAMTWPRRSTVPGRKEAHDIKMADPGSTANFGHPASCAGRRIAVPAFVTADEIDRPGRSVPVPDPCGALRGSQRAIQGETRDRLAAHRKGASPVPVMAACTVRTTP